MKNINVIRCLIFLLGSISLSLSLFAQSGETDPIWTAAKSAATVISGNWSFTGSPIMNVRLTSSNQSILSVDNNTGSPIYSVNANYTPSTSTWSNANSYNAWGILANSYGFYLSEAPPGTTSGDANTFWANRSLLATQSWATLQNVTSKGATTTYPITLNNSNNQYSLNIIGKTTSQEWSDLQIQRTGYSNLSVGEAPNISLSTLNGSIDNAILLQGANNNFQVFTTINSGNSYVERMRVDSNGLTTLFDGLIVNSLHNPISLNLGSDTIGDMYYRNSRGNLTRIGIGSSNQIMTVSGGLPTWVTPSYLTSLNGGTDINIGGTAPNRTINNTSTLQTITGRGAITTNPITINKAPGNSASLTVEGNTTSNVTGEIQIDRSGPPSYLVGEGSNLQLENTTDVTALNLQETSGALQVFNYTPTQGYRERLRIDTLGNIMAENGSRFNSGGSPSQFLKGDGSLDGTSYLPVSGGTITGNLGIGTTNPQSKLAVNGTITATEVKVTQTGWSDYVFDPAYRLPNLSATSAYIKTNHHLPDIPSAKQIENKGLNLGDMEKKQMQKIEELTLYIIKEDKKNDEQDRLIMQLLKMNKMLEGKMIKLERQANLSKNVK